MFKICPERIFMGPKNIEILSPLSCFFSEQILGRVKEICLLHKNVLHKLKYLKKLLF